MVVNWFELLKDDEDDYSRDAEDKDPAEFRTTQIDPLLEAYVRLRNPNNRMQAAYNFRDNLTHIPGGLYTEMATNVGQREMEDAFINMLIHEGVHQVQHNMGEELLTDRKRILFDRKQFETAIMEYFEPAGNNNYRPKARYLVTSRPTGYQRRNQRTNQRRVLSNEAQNNISNILRDYLGDFVERLDTYLKTNILIETQAYLVTEPFRTALDNFRTTGGFTQNQTQSLIRGIVGSSFTTLVPIAEELATFVERIVSHLNGNQIRSFARTRIREIRAKADNLEGDATRYVQYLLSRILTQFAKEVEKNPNRTEERKTNEGMKGEWQDILKLDPVGEEDEDIDNDGDQDSTDEYLLNRRKKISENIKKKDMSYCVCSGPNKTRGFTCSQHCKHGRK